MAQEAAVDGISPEMAEAVRKQASFDNEVVEENISFRERYTRSMKNNAGLKFNNFKQREYDYDELEKKLLGWDDND